MADIAEQVGLPRSNLHYYFSTKDDLYRAVLLGLLEVWKQDALCFEMYDDPRVVLSTYIRAKMNHSRTRAHGSKVWADEIIHGAPMLGATLDDSLYSWAKMKEAKIRQWVDDQRILAVEPSALLYMIWASTQHYADFSHQVGVLNGHQCDSARDRPGALICSRGSPLKRPLGADFAVRAAPGGKTPGFVWSFGASLG